MTGWARMRARFRSGARPRPQGRLDARAAGRVHRRAVARPAASSRPAGASACRARAPTSSIAGRTRRASAAPGMRPRRRRARRGTVNFQPSRQLPRRRRPMRAPFTAVALWPVPKMAPPPASCISSSSSTSPTSAETNGACRTRQVHQLPRGHQLDRAAPPRERPAYSLEAFARAVRAARRARAK